MKLLIFSLVLIAAVAGAEGKRKFAGVITDSMCAKGDHSQMGMGPTNGECATACVSVHGATYVLYDGKESYTLSDQRAPEKYAGKKVTVTGTLDSRTMTIQVDSMIAAN